MSAQRTKHRMKEVDISIIQKPIFVEWECPECFWNNSINFHDFLCGEEYCNWSEQEVECEDCGEKFKIDSIEWD